MEDDSLALADSPAVAPATSTDPVAPSDTHRSEDPTAAGTGDDDVALDDAAGGTHLALMLDGNMANAMSTGPDLTMAENAAAADDAVAKPADETSTTNAPPPSDNPLDAPDAPRPQDEDDEAGEDEEMTGTADETKKENGSPEKDGGEGTAADDAAADRPTQTKASLESSARSHLIAQTHAIILPSYSTWFDMHLIHPLERKALPEFFNSRNRSKTPIVYKDYRDFMINTYRLNPSEYLTVTACRRNLAGDVCAIMRVHAFLEQWGLINYQIDPDTRPSSIGPPFTGHFRVTADTPRGLQPFQPAPTSTATAGKPFAGTERALNAAPASKAELNLEIRRNIYDQAGKEVSSPDVKPGEKQANGEPATTNGATTTDPAATTKTLDGLLKEPKKPINCFTCGVDCTRVRYHSAKSTPPVPPTAGAAPATKSKFDICPSCFLEGRFPSSSSAVDFVKLEDPTYSTVAERDAPWTDAELLLLLEGLELFDDNWGSVADHVGTRTREECVLKFLQLEIEDKYLESEAAVDGANGLGVLTGGRVPYSQADNPVLSVLGFLATLSDQNVAAAAAGRTAEEMRRGLRDRLEKGSSGDKDKDRDSDKGKEKEKEKAKEGLKNEDTMDVDVDVDSAPPSTALTTTADATSSTPIQGPAGTTPLSAIPLATSAARAAALASHEEREMTRLVSSAVNSTLQKLEQKLRQFNEMESILQAERRELERGRQQLFLDRLAFKKRVREAQDSLRLAAVAVQNASAGASATATTNGTNGAAEVSPDVKAALDAAGPGIGETRLGFERVEQDTLGGASGKAVKTLEL
ncbi:MAG: hypothetical protein M1838_004965 [Thelocarpon superellum]|nr:MAG: hypothetical protein M1838_004965 [Thelocarpon superellum]